MLPVMVSTKTKRSPRKLAASSSPQMAVMASTPTVKGGRRADRTLAAGLDIQADPQDVEVVVSLLTGIASPPGG